MATTTTTTTPRENKNKQKQFIKSSETKSRTRDGGGNYTLIATDTNNLIFDHDNNNKNENNNVFDYDKTQFSTMEISTSTPSSSSSSSSSRSSSTTTTPTSSHSIVSRSGTPRQILSLRRKLPYAFFFLLAIVGCTIAVVSVFLNQDKATKEVETSSQVPVKNFEDGIYGYLPRESNSSSNNIVEKGPDTLMASPSTVIPIQSKGEEEEVVLEKEDEVVVVVEEEKSNNEEEDERGEEIVGAGTEKKDIEIDDDPKKNFNDLSNSKETKEDEGNNSTSIPSAETPEQSEEEEDQSEEEEEEEKDTDDAVTSMPSTEISEQLNEEKDKEERDKDKEEDEEEKNNKENETIVKESDQVEKKNEQSSSSTFSINEIIGVHDAQKFAADDRYLSKFRQFLKQRVPKEISLKRIREEMRRLYWGDFVQDEKFWLSLCGDSSNENPVRLCDFVEIKESYSITLDQNITTVAPINFDRFEHQAQAGLTRWVPNTVNHNENLCPMIYFTSRSAQALLEEAKIAQIVSVGDSMSRHFSWFLGGVLNATAQRDHFAHEDQEILKTSEDLATLYDEHPEYNFAVGRLNTEKTELDIQFQDATKNSHGGVGVGFRWAPMIWDIEHRLQNGKRLCDDKIPGMEKHSIVIAANNAWTDMLTPEMYNNTKLRWDSVEPIIDALSADCPANHFFWRSPNYFRGELDLGNPISMALDAKKSGYEEEKKSPWTFLEIDEYFVASKISHEKSIPVVDAFHIDQKLSAVSWDGHHYLRYVDESEVHVFLSHLLCMIRGGLL